jgi:hypothetical protein
MEVRGIIGCWYFDPGSVEDPEIRKSCAIHILDDWTYVVEQNTEEGLMVSWFQYWLIEKGILSYPLSELTRQGFRAASEIEVSRNGECLTFRGYVMTPLKERKLPPRKDRFPGSMPKEGGGRKDASFSRSLEELLEAPPKG